MTFSLRARLLLTTAPVFVVLAGLAASGLIPSVLVGVTLASGGLVAGAILLLTAPFERLRAAAAQALEQTPGAFEAAGVVRAADGTREVARTIDLLLDRLCETHEELAERERQFALLLNQLPPFLGAMFKEARPLRTPDPASPWPELNAALLVQLHSADKAAVAFQRRLQAFAGILDELPEGVLVGDERGQVVYSNAAAGLLFPTRDFRTKPLLAKCFGNPPDRARDDPDAPNPLPAEQVAEWAYRTHGGLSYAVSDDNETVLAVRLLPASKCKSLPCCRVLLVRDISAEAASAAAARQRQRRDVGQRLCLLVHSVATPALEGVRTQAGLLTQAAKQTGQRERFLPKVARLLEELNRQEVVVTLLGWLGRLNRPEGNQPDAAEVRLKDVVDAVAEKVQPLLRERSNVLEVRGDAGWLVTDEDWLTSLVLGVLTHANYATERQKIRVELGRRSGSAGQIERSEFQVRFAGPPFPAQLATDVTDPFGRPNTAALKVGGGFALGLSVATRIARLAGGELRIEHADGDLVIRALLPTRGAHSATAPPGAGGRPEPAFESTDVLGEWGVGGGAPAEERPAAPPEVPAPAGTEPAFVADTVGAWFGGPQS